MAASDLRTELAATAARLIAEEGCEYAQAKRRAVQEILGEGARRSTLPDNSEVERELRRYLKLFGGETHRALLVALRTVAADTMQTLREFEPHLIGAVLNGTATEHSDVHLQLFVDSAKDVELRLMHLGIEFDVDDGDADGERPAAIERLNFVVPAAANARSPQRMMIGIRLHIYARDAIRIAARHKRDVTPEEGVHPIEATGRANLGSLRRLIDETGE
jgi:Tat protein secretion system quality control protein TatD with DNase activity